MCVCTDMCVTVYVACAMQPRVRENNKRSSQKKKSETRKRNTLRIERTGQAHNTSTQYHEVH